MEGYTSQCTIVGHIGILHLRPYRRAQRSIHSCRFQVRGIHDTSFHIHPCRLSNLVRSSLLDIYNLTNWRSMVVCWQHMYHIQSWLGHGIRGSVGHKGLPRSYSHGLPSLVCIRILRTWLCTHCGYIRYSHEKLGRDICGLAHLDVRRRLGHRILGRSLCSPRLSIWSHIRIDHLYLGCLVHYQHGVRSSHSGHSRSWCQSCC